MTMRKQPLRIGATQVAVLLVLVASAAAHEDGEHEHPPRVPDKVIYRATAVPDRIVLSWISDPATSQAVTWRTDATVSRGLAEMAPAGDGPSFPIDAQHLTAATEMLKTDLGEVHYHTLNFEKLKPDTKYAYRVGDGVHWSEWLHFRTAADKPQPFTFVYFGDAQNDIKSHWSRVIREAHQDAPRAAFFLHAGDLVNRAESDAEWGQWFEASGFIPRMIPVIATPGNHEYTKSADGDRRLSHHWRPTFAFPENGPAGLEEATYYVDYQGARIISLNSNLQLDPQSQWLEKVLSENQLGWTIVTFHHPVYSSGLARDNKELRDRWQPIFDRHGVDLVLQGHDHTYARTGLMRHKNLATGVTRQEESSGTLYVVSVSGPKQYPLHRQPWMRRVAENTQPLSGDHR